jgi:quercetin dioxygenase-like cupin family protein
MKIKHWTDVPAQVAEGIDGVTIRWVIGEEDGAPHFAMRVLEVQPGCASPYHNHWWEHEVYVLDGQGAVVSGAGDTPISSGSVILVEGNEIHQFRNTGDDVLRFMCLIPWKWLEGLAETQGKSA